MGIGKWHKALGIVPADAVPAPRDNAVPGWEGVPPEQRALFARHMETYGAMLDCVDQNVRRLVALLDEMGEFDNTIIVLSSDNGGTGPGGPSGSLHFNRHFSGLPRLPVEQNVARTDWVGSGRGAPVIVSNAPFPAYKTYAAGGGRRAARQPDRVLAVASSARARFAASSLTSPTSCRPCWNSPACRR